MRFKEPIEVKLNDEFSIITQNVWLNNRGVPAGEFYIYNGEPIHGDTFCPANNAARRRFIRAVIERGVNVTEQEMESGLLLLSSNLSTKLADEIEAGQEGDSRAPSQATQLVQLAEDAELFHTPDNEAYATIEVNDHKETWPVKVKGFRRYLLRRYYEETRASASAQALQDALGILEGKAIYDGPERPVFTRIAEFDGRVYLDLANDKWEAIEITRSGWNVVSEPTIRFRRSRGMLALPYPVSGGSIRELRPFVNATQTEWPLLIEWQIAALSPKGPYPLLTLCGEQGSAKSTLARLIRSLIDPNVAPLRSAPRDERDLMIWATNGWIIALDNLSHIPQWLSNALCRLATGGGFATRELYSDADEVLFDAMRPVLLTGIEELATQSDLADRTIITYLPAIEEEKRRPESVFWEAFERVRPRVLGALLDGVSVALRNVDSVRLDRLPRMADFAIWATAAEPGLELEPGEFMRAYTANRKSANDLALESSHIPIEIRAFMESNEQWEGTATELLEELNRQASETIQRQKEWPKSPRSLTNALRRFMPNLRVAGIRIKFKVRKSNKGWNLLLERVCIVESPESPESQPESKPIEDEEISEDSGSDYRSDHSDHRVTEEPDTYNPSSQAKSKKTQSENKASDGSDRSDDKKRTYSNRPSREFIPCPTCNEEGERLTDCLNCGDLIK